MNILIIWFLSVAAAIEPSAGHRAIVDMANSPTVKANIDSFNCQVAQSSEEIPPRVNQTRVNIWREYLTNAYAVQVVQITGRTIDGKEVRIDSASITMTRDYYGHELPSEAVLQRGEKDELASAVQSASHASEDTHCIGFLPLGEYIFTFRLLRLDLGKHTGAVPLVVPIDTELYEGVVDTRRYGKIDKFYRRKVRGQDVRVNINYARFRPPAIVPVPIQR